MAQQAQDTFVATMPDGTMRRIAKGDVLADWDDLVKHDQASGGNLFRKLELGEGEPAAKKTLGRRAS